MLIAIENPFSTEGINSLGILPPFISLINCKPSPSKSESTGDNSNFISANFPRPPDCFLYTSLWSTDAVIASLYATWGAPWLHSTLNSLFNLSIIISKCNSPIPEIIVCPESSSVLTVKVGSSSANLPSATPNLSKSFCVLGSTAIPITGSGKSIDSNTIGEFKSHSVSPVLISLKPTNAAISPAFNLSIWFCLLECIW